MAQRTIKLPPFHDTNMSVIAEYPNANRYDATKASAAQAFLPTTFTFVSKSSVAGKTGTKTVMQKFTFTHVEQDFHEAVKEACESLATNKDRLDDYVKTVLALLDWYHI